MDTFKVIDLPAEAWRDGRSRRARYPWRTLKVHQAFFVPGVTSSAMAAGAWQASKRTGFKYRCDTETRDGVVGVLVSRYA
jgi:hypothetical protein